MRAVCLQGSEIRFDSEYESAASHPHFVRVSPIVAGICETDLQLSRGYMGFQGVPGHEFVGIAQSGPFFGQRVVGEINCSCGRCDFCSRGMSRHCPNRSVIGILNHDGAFADSVWVPQENLHLVPDSVPTDHAVFAEPVAAACRIPEQLSLDRNTSVTILGAGRLGNLCAQVLTATGCQVCVVGKHDWKLQRLRDLNIDVCLLQEFAPDGSSDVVVDCTGSPSGIEVALQTVHPCGTIVLKTTVADSQSVHLAPIVIDEVSIVGSRCGPFQPALDLIENGSVQVESLISARYPIEAAVDAFEHAQRPNALKVLFDISDESTE